MSQEQRRVAILGAGAMGASLAAITSRFAPTVIVCRNPARAAQLFEAGVVVTGAFEAHARPIIVRSPEELGAVGGVSYLFIATKTNAIPDVCAQLAGLHDRIAQTQDGVRLISYQNGIDPGRQIMALLESNRVMRMVLNYGAVLREPDGAVEVLMRTPPHYIGCLDDTMIEDSRWLASRFTEASFETHYTPDIETHVWAKAVLNAAFNPVCALVNSTVGQVLESPAQQVALDLLDEGIAVAKAEGIPLPPEYREKALDMIRGGAHHLPSMVEDIRSGRPSEVGQLNRQIMNHAQSLGVPTPTHNTIDALIETFDWRVFQGRTPVADR